MRSAIIAGTDIYQLPGVSLQAQTIETSYGPALVHLGQGEHEDLVFLTRHGPRHDTPPHRVNFRANLKALQTLGVRTILAAYAVGSINPDIPPQSLVLLDDFLDFSAGRPLSFYNGGDSGLGHTIMSPPYCPTLRRQVLALASEFDLKLRPQGAYVCTNGPRFETPAEIRFYARIGGDVVGMTAAQEATLARELGMHLAGVALSINWAAGIEPTINIVCDGMVELRARLLALFVQALAAAHDFDCPCERAVLFTHRPA